jgi:tetratricopeptide (TPR) repeat protein
MRKVLLALVLVVLTVVGYVAVREEWARYHLRQARSAIDRFDFAAAQTHLKKCLAVWPTDYETLLLAARTARRGGNIDEARQLFDECDRIPGQHPGLKRERALLVVQLGTLPTPVVRGLLAKIEKNDPDSPVYLEALIQGYLKTYRLGEALYYVECLLRLRADHVMALMWRGNIFQGLSRLVEAEEDYRRILNLRPDFSSARLRLAEVLLVNSKTGEAHDQFAELYAGNPTDPQILLGLARCFQLEGETDRSRNFYLRSLQEKSDFTPALRELGKLELTNGNLITAHDHLVKATICDPADGEACFALAQCLRQLNRPAEAKKYQKKWETLQADQERLRKLVEQIGKEPGNAILRFEAGKICMSHGRESEALRWFAGVLQLDPNHQPTHRFLTEYFEKSGRPKLAEQHRKQIKKE